MDRKPSVPLDKILNLVPAGVVFENIVLTLASRLSRHGLEVNPINRAAIQKASSAKTLPELSAGLRVTVEAASRRLHLIHSDELGFFDPNEPIAYLDGNLPHWRQDGVTYFITFRTSDSIPQEKLRFWMAERDVWLRENPEPHSPEQRKQYWKLFPNRIHKWLDAGYGECLLKDVDTRQMVVDAILHFAGDRYQLKEWVVMPNHVHVIVTPLGQHQLSDILHS